MIDVFLRLYATTFLRAQVANAVHERLRMQKGISLWIITCEASIQALPHVVAIKVDSDNFHLESKKKAEEMAHTPIYCVIDDDQCPIANDFFEVGAATLANHPEYGMLAGFPLEYAVHGQPYADRTEDVIEAHSIGCPYFVRCGTLSFPDGPLRQYDGILSKVITDQGLKTGFVRKCLYNHLGYGFSQIGYE